MNVKELNKEQLTELKEHYYVETHNSVSYDDLANIDMLVSDEKIFEEYSNTIFCDDDFFTNSQNEEE